MDKRYFGVMIDCSRNAVMKVEKVKEFVDYVSAFGYNMLSLYTEDTFEVNNEPRFGYLRGRYSKDEIKEIDNYCALKGVELIPCVQVLAHLNQIFRWREYNAIKDFNDILLVDDERTYQLIENIFQTISQTFSSKRINIGMDEAHMVGLGKYLDKHGFENRFDILRKHLDKVVELAKKYELKPMMWSDMFFRLANNGEYYGDNMTEEARKSVPNEMSLIYWDYYHDDYEHYKKIISAHQKFNKELWFAGGAWTWKSFAPDNAYSLKTMFPAMDACKDLGVENIFLTMWGDDGKECSTFAVLPSLFAIKEYYDGNKDLNSIKRKFKSVTGEDFDHMISLDLPNRIYSELNGENPCKYLLYNDLFCGFLDSTISGDEAHIFADGAKRLSEYSKNSKFSYIFNELSLLLEVLQTKCDLGLELRNAYKNKDKQLLKSAEENIEKVSVKLKEFYKAFEELWMTENKPFGFEVHQARIGGLLLRLEYCGRKVKDYLDGKIDRIEELEQDILDYETGSKQFNKRPIYLNLYKNIITTNVL